MKITKCLTLTIALILFIAITFPNASAETEFAAVEATPPTVCNGSFQLNGTTGVNLDSGCNDNLQHIGFTRVANPNVQTISSGQITYVYFGINNTLYVFSTDPNDFGSVTFAAFRKNVSNK